MKRDTAAYCLSIHDTNNVTVHCNGHHLSDAADYSSNALIVRNVQGFTIQDCLITTDVWYINDSSDGHILDSHVAALPNIDGTRSSCARPPADPHCPTGDRQVDSGG